MIFTAFIIVAVWMLELPEWLQICITVFGVLHALFSTGTTIVHNRD